MIIEQQKNLELEKAGEVKESTTMTIDSASVHILMGFLSKNVYSDAIGSTVREWTSNAWDATVKSGKQEPIIVKLAKNEFQNWEFSVEDKALGFDQDDVKNIVSKYLFSTKRQDNTQLGAIGIGLKSGLAYTNSFTFIGRKDGIERAWMMYEDESENKIDLLYEKATSEQNGVKFTLTVNYYDVREFSQKIRTQLSYFSNVYIIDEYNKYNNDFKIYENELFKFSENHNDNHMHVCLGDVYYPLDFAKLGLSPINVPVAVKLGLDERVVPTISRESLMLSVETKALLLSKIEKIADFFVNLYNANSVRKSFEDCYEEIGKNDRKVKFVNKVFTINSLAELSKIPLNEISVESLSHVPLKTLKEEFNRLMNYRIVARISWNSTYAVNFNYLDYTTLTTNNIGVLGNEAIIKGNFKSFLAKQRDSINVYVKKNEFDVHDYTRTKVIFLKEVDKKNRLKAYQQLIALRKHFEKKFIDKTNLYISKEYQEYKLKLRLEANKTYVSKPKIGLNKKKGDVTFGVVVPKYGRSGFKVEKTLFKIEHLHRVPKNFILFKSEQEKEAKEFKEAISKFTNYEVAVLGPNELRKVQLNKKFMLFAKIKDNPKESKLIKQIATAHLFHKAIIEFDAIRIAGPEGVVSEFISSLDEDYQKIKNYSFQYRDRYENEDIVDELIKKCEEEKGFDYTLWEQYLNVHKACEELSFLRYLRSPKGDSDKKQYAKFINELIVCQKLLRGKDVSMFEVCAVHKEPVDEIVEQKVEETETIL